jgi:hypothetical protein
MQRADGAALTRFVEERSKLGPKFEDLRVALPP